MPPLAFCETGYTESVRRLRVALLLIIAVWNSGGLGYWVCHGQIQSSCFWLKVCPEDHSDTPAYALIPLPPPETVQIVPQLCDCHFVSISVPVPQAPEIQQGVVVVVHLPRLELLSDLPTECRCVFNLEPELSPPDFVFTPTALRAPPVV